MTSPEQVADDIALLNRAINDLIEARTHIENMFKTIYMTTTTWEQLSPEARNFVAGLLATQMTDTVQGDIATVANHVMLYN